MMYIWTGILPVRHVIGSVGMQVKTTLNKVRKMGERRRVVEAKGQMTL